MHREMNNWASPDVVSWCSCTDTHSSGGPMPVKGSPSAPYGIAADYYYAVPAVRDWCLSYSADWWLVVAVVVLPHHSEWQMVSQILSPPFQWPVVVLLQQQCLRKCLMEQQQGYCHWLESADSMDVAQSVVVVVVLFLLHSSQCPLISLLLHSPPSLVGHRSIEPESFVVGVVAVVVLGVVVGVTAEVIAVNYEVEPYCPSPACPIQ